MRLTIERFSSLQFPNSYVLSNEEKNFLIIFSLFSEIDDKHARRDRYQSGPITDFKEKDNYRPEVNIEYADEQGRRMNEKEAFRFLSHRFHGKGSGKKKIEKRAKKIMEEEVTKKLQRN
jgi:U4/U6.U5 tri-snRNP-associated protein 1